jgi:hypothetical protein
MVLEHFYDVGMNLHSVEAIVHAVEAFCHTVEAFGRTVEALGHGVGTNLHAVGMNLRSVGVFRHGVGRLLHKVGRDLRGIVDNLCHTGGDLKGVAGFLRLYGRGIGSDLVGTISDRVHKSANRKCWKSFICSFNSSFAVISGLGST